MYHSGKRYTGVAQSVTCTDGVCMCKIYNGELETIAIVLLYQVTLGVLVLFSLKVQGKCGGWAYA